MWRRTHSIRVRIVAAFLAAMIALLSAQGYLIALQRPVVDSLSLMAEGYIPLSKIVGRLDRDAQRVDRDIARLLRAEQRPGAGRTAPTIIYTEELEQSLELGRIRIRRLRRLGLSPEEQAVLAKIEVYLDAIEDLFRQYQESSTRFLELAEAGRMDQARREREPLQQISSALSDEIGKLERTIDARIVTLVESTERAQIRGTTVAAALSALALAFAILLVGAVLYALRPVGELTRQVQRLAVGDYSGRVEVGARADEVAALAGEFNAMASAIEARDRALVDRAEELNRVSRYLSSVLDGLEDCLMVFEGGRTTLTNPAAERVWGSKMDAAPPEALAGFVAIPGGYSLKRPDGTVHQVRVTAFGHNGVVVIGVDVTEKTRAEERLARSERLALIGQMLAQITHEVRNPLNSLSLNAELLGDELQELDPGKKTEAWDILDLVAREIDRLTEVTGHYLQLARRPPAQRRDTDVVGVIEDVTRLLQPELDAEGVVLELTMPAVLNAVVDGSQLKQALLNVTRNAVEAGARRLSLSVGASPDLTVVLVDDGPGMTAEEAERASDPFFSTKVAGTGLGLAITKQIIEDHHGWIEVDSTLGEGTTVSLVIPMAASATGIQAENT